MYSKSQLDQVRLFLTHYEQLERKNTTPEGWIQLKLSCSTLKAQRLVRASGYYDAKVDDVKTGSDFQSKNGGRP